MSRLLQRIKHIYRNEGSASLIKKALTSLWFLIPLEFNTFYLYYIVTNQDEMIESPSLPSVRNFIFQIVTTNNQLDDIINKRQDLSLLNIKQVRHRLKRGAIAFLILVNNEVASIVWLALTEKAKGTFNKYPYKVDFENGECCVGGAWTNPKYRKQGLTTYTIYKIKEYRKERRFNKSISIALKGNETIHRLYEKDGAVRYGQAYYFEIFGLKFWKETPIT